MMETMATGEGTDFTVLLKFIEAYGARELAIGMLLQSGLGSGLGLRLGLGLGLGLELGLG